MDTFQFTNSKQEIEHHWKVKKKIEEKGILITF